jgi:hypothetical protein
MSSAVSKTIWSVCGIILLAVIAGLILIFQKPIPSNQTSNLQIQSQASCPLQEQPGRHIIHLMSTDNSPLIAIGSPDQATFGPTTISPIPAGIYNVTLVTYINSNKNEQSARQSWQLILNGPDNSYLGTTNAISDLPADKQYFSEQVNSNMVLSEEVASVTAKEANYPDKNPNKLWAICAGFDEVSNSVSQPPTLEFVSTNCNQSSPKITLDYSANGPSTKIEIYRNNQLVKSDSSPTISPAIQSFTDTGLSAGQAYSYKARAFFNSTASVYTNDLFLVAPTCSPQFTAAVSISKVNDLPYTNTQIKSGDIVIYQIAIQNIGSSSATSMNLTNTFSNAIYNPKLPNSLTCTPPTSCMIDSSTARSVKLHTNSQINPEQAVLIYLKIQIGSGANSFFQAQGQFQPGNLSFRGSYLISLRNNITPSFQITQ